VDTQTDGRVQRAGQPLSALKREEGAVNPGDRWRWGFPGAPRRNQLCPTWILASEACGSRLLSPDSDMTNSYCFCPTCLSSLLPKILLG
jgi:hypothetical protein